MESQLDMIANGKASYSDYLRNFYIDGVNTGSTKLKGLTPLAELHFPSPGGVKIGRCAAFVRAGLREGMMDWRPAFS